MSDSELALEVQELFADAMVTFHDSTQKFKRCDQTWRFDDISPSWDDRIRARENEEESR